MTGRNRTRALEPRALTRRRLLEGAALSLAACAPGLGSPPAGTSDAPLLPTPIRPRARDAETPRDSSFAPKDDAGSRPDAGSRRDASPSCVDASAPSASLPRARNLLFLFVDDLNDWIAPLGGHPQTITPNLSRLAHAGFNFTNAHTASPECNSSRVATLTGLRPSTTGIYDVDLPLRTARPNAQTLFQRFRTAGFEVLGAGKVFHYPDPASFDSYYQPASDPLPPAATRPVNGIPGAGDFDWGPIDVPLSRMGDHQLATWAASQLTMTHSGPFAIACGFRKPHLPFYVPREFFERFGSISLPPFLANDLDDVPPSGLAFAAPGGDHARVIAADQWEAAVRGYLASISFFDSVLGIVLDALERGPNADDTLVVLTTDHGWHLGEKLHWRKFALWEEATRVPLMLAGGGLRSGLAIAHPVSLIDLFPTLLEAFGLPAQPGDGRSLGPLLANPDLSWTSRAITTWLEGNHALRT
ncbi:MAG: sulfatase, partial [Deltaproteobacteria bacterium]|nr:sulfatase [Deltaproteobacteria bacterium]